MKLYYRWRCAKEMPFLEEHVWKIIGPLLDAGKKEIQAYRLRTGFDLKTARENIKPEVTQEFHRLTGIHFDIISHHRLSNWALNVKIVVIYFVRPKPNIALIVVKVEYVRLMSNEKKHDAG